MDRATQAEGLPVKTGLALVTLRAPRRFAPWVLTALERAAIALLTDLVQR